MNQDIYEKPALIKYGGIKELTQASGTSGADLIITGAINVINNPDGSVSTDGNISAGNGSGISVNGALIR